MSTARWANIILGVWLVLSPFVLGFATNEAIWNNIIVGILVVAFAFVGRHEYTTARRAL